MKYSVATNWDNDLIDYYSELNKSGNDKIFQVFASKAFSVLGSANSDIPDLLDSEIQSKITHAKDRGINFNYLINSSIVPDLSDKNANKAALEYLNFVNSLDINIVTVANLQVLDLITKNFPKIDVNISIVFALKNIAQVNDLRLKHKNIKRITLHNSLNRNKLGLIRHIKNAHNSVHGLEPVEVEILANEICFQNCPIMKKHYEYLSSQSQKRNIMDFEYEWCGKKRAGNILDFINSSWIRPEDIYLYEELGIDIIKLAGRKEPTQNLKLRTKAYIERNYNGNVMDLFLKEFWSYNKPPYIDNSILDGFIKYLFDNNISDILELKEYKNFENLSYKWN